MQIQNAIITGSFSYNGADLSNVTSSNAYSASLSSRTTNLESTSSVLVGASASFSSILSSVSSSQQQLSSSFLTLTASFNAVSASQQQISASYIALSGSYNTFSGSASTRITVDSASLLQVSASYIALSGSYNTFSGSASTRVTQIENVYATTGSNSFRANQSITGSLVVSSTITAQTLIVQTVTSSIIYSSGSNLFGSALGDRQTFTGSVNITGSTNLVGALKVNKIGINTGNINLDNNSSNLIVSGAIAFANSSGGTAALVDRDGSGNTTFYGGSGDIKFTDVTFTSNYLTIKSAGNVGIGTVSPGAKLDICQLGGDSTRTCHALYLRAGNNSDVFNSNQILFSYNGGTDYAHAIKTRHNSNNACDNAIDFYTWRHGDDASTKAGRYVMTIAGNGNVGIGTTIPSGTGIVLNAKGISGNTVSMVIAESYDTGSMVSLYSGAACSDDPSLIYLKNLRFGSGNKDTSAYVERMRITSCGKIGIGAIDPKWLLEICCNTTATGGGGYPAIAINNPNDAGYSAYYFFKGSTNMGGLELSNASCYLFVNTNCTFAIKTNNNERLRVTSEGYVNISGYTTNMGTGALNVYQSGSGGGIAGNQIWLKGGNTDVASNSNAIIFSYWHTLQYSHAIKSSHASATVKGNSLDFYIWNQASDSSTTIGTKKIMSIDGSGVTKPYQPAFQVYACGDNQVITNSAVTKLNFHITRYDVGGNLISDAGRFRAPFCGRYLFTSQVRFDSSSGSSYMRLLFSLNGSTDNFTYGHVIAGPGGYSTNYQSLSISAVLNLAEGDCITVLGGLDTGTTNRHNESQFSGYFLG